MVAKPTEIVDGVQVRLMDSSYHDRFQIEDRSSTAERLISLDVVGFFSSGMMKHDGAPTLYG